MENYIMLNGKKIMLTPEQVKLMQEDKPKKSPFDRADLNDKFYLVESDFNCLRTIENNTELDNYLFECGNYCTDKNIMEQHALHMKLNNLLWRYSMTHGGDEVDWYSDSTKVFIYYNANTDSFRTSECYFVKYFGAVPFVNSKTAEAAIEEIVEPFIKEHPDFDVTKM